MAVNLEDQVQKIQSLWEEESACWLAVATGVELVRSGSTLDNTIVRSRYGTKELPFREYIRDHLARYPSDIKAKIHLKGERPKIFLCYSLIESYGPFYTAGFRIENRRFDEQRMEMALGEIPDQLTIWEADISLANFSGRLPIDLERAVRSCYKEKRISKDIKSEIKAHCYALKKTLRGSLI